MPMWQIPLLLLMIAGAVPDPFGQNARFSPGHDPRWAQPDFQDDSWSLAPLNQLLDELPPEGWFRLRYALPAGTPRGLRLGIPAEAEFFLDGRRLEPLARVNGHLIGNQVLTVTGFSHYLLPLPADDRQHLLAIHFKGLGSDHPAAALLPMTLSLVQVEPVNDLIDHQRFALTISFHRNLFMAVCFSFTLIHLLLYLGYRAFKPNLHYAGMTLTSGLLCMLFFDIFVTHDFGWWMTLQRLATPLLALNMFACMSLAHVLTVGRARTTPYIAAFFLALSTWGFLQPFLVFEVQGSVVLVAFGEVLRVLYLVKRGKVRVAVSGGGVLVVGALPAMAAFLYQLAVFNLPIEPIAGFFEFPVLFYSGLPLMLAMSLFLSRHFAKTNQDLILRLEEIESLNRKVVAQEVEQARLEGENERTTQELEAARNLQLSLLPQTMPRLPGFTVSTVMKTATEVGGDYYDVEVNGGDPVLTIGDATGHGLRAGNMVVATKSLFAAYARHKDPAEMLSSISVALERLQFQNMFMALTIIQIQEDRLILSMGGMPPALVYRAADKTVERLHLKNIPLGVLPKFAYQTLETRMHPGDVMLLMTDGLMERFDPADDMFGLDRIVDVLAQSADRGPDALMDALMQAGDRWGNGRPTDDDITFLVLQRDG